jgi:hypothetical protein
MSQQEILSAVELVPGPKVEVDVQFEAEKKAFWAMKDQLLGQYEGQYVAVHEGQVVDSDPDKLRLGLRIYARFGYQPIYVQLVSRQELPIKQLASPRLWERV